MVVRKNKIILRQHYVNTAANRDKPNLIKEWISNQGEAQTNLNCGIYTRPEKKKKIKKATRIRTRRGTKAGAGGSRG